MNECHACDICIHVVEADDLLISTSLPFYFSPGNVEAQIRKAQREQKGGIHGYNWDAHHKMPMIPKDGSVLGFIHVSNNSKPDESIIDLQCDPAESSLIQSILGATMDVGEFMDVFWKTRPMLLKGKTQRVEGIKEMFNNLSVRDMLESSASESIQCWLQCKDDPSTSSSKPQVHSPVLSSTQCSDAEQAFKLYQAGHSLYCRAP